MQGWLIGGETFPVSSLLGTTFVLTGVWMIFRKAGAKEDALQEREPGVQVPEG